MERADGGGSGQTLPKTSAESSSEIRQDEKSAAAETATDGYPPEIAEQAVAYAESFGYIDDSRYARRYLDGPGERKSRTAARVDLIRKGISSDLVDRILQETEAESEETEREKAVSLARKRVGEPHRLDDKEYRRTYAYLARRGFSSSDICFALDEYKTKEF